MVSDSVGISESVSYAKGKAPAISDNVGITEQNNYIENALGLARKAIRVESVGITESVAFIISKVKTITENTLIDLLKMVNKGEDIKSIGRFSNKDTLINQSDKTLAILKWDTKQAQKYLNKYFNKKSRSNLEIKELLKFNVLLNQELVDNS